MKTMASNCALAHSGQSMSEITNGESQEVDYEAS